jgi:cation diffusion facilitator family transporter
MKQKLGYITATVSIITNILLFALKMWVGITSGSIALITDAWHTISDSITSIIVFVGFWISGKPKDQQHPFGHGRAELISSIMIGTLLGVIGFHFLKDSILQIYTNHSVHLGKNILIVSAISLIIKEAMAQLSFWAGKKTNSHSLTADGWHHRSDAFTSLLIIIGVIASKYFWWIDSALGIVIAIFILYTAIEIIKSSSDKILGTYPDKKFIENLKQIIEKTEPSATNIHHIHLHQYGDHSELTLHIELPKNILLEEAHEIVTKIENSLREKLNIEPTIHYEPQPRA